MTSRIISFIKFFQRGNAAAASGANPNSWATVGLWRRFFELKEQEEQENYESVVEILQELYDGPSLRPIESEQAIQTRREMMRDYYRGLRSSNTNNNSSNGVAAYMNNNNNNNNVSHSHFYRYFDIIVVGRSVHLQY
mmetsp:Transcript_17575/g.22198  ORF Transcript_17575/g.22198 Transcript_17575/m.22198 type:complete len:137 (-) Transcript_17575:17-427(-)